MRFLFKFVEFMGGVFDVFCVEEGFFVLVIVCIKDWLELFVEVFESLDWSYYWNFEIFVVNDGGEWFVLFEDFLLLFDVVDL